MAEERIELRQHILGLQPYVLLTLRLNEDEDLSIDLEYGGGIPGLSDARDVLITALSGLDPLTDEEAAALRRPEIGEAH